MTKTISPERLILAYLHIRMEIHLTGPGYIPTAVVDYPTESNIKEYVTYIQDLVMVLYYVRALTGSSYMHWLHTENKAFECAPKDLLDDPSGCTKVLSYLEGHMQGAFY